MTKQAQQDRFRDWLDRYRGVVVRIVRSFAETPEDFDDLLQEVLLQLWSSAKAFRGDSAESTWVYRVALNRALVWRRKELRRKSALRLVDADLAELPARDRDLDDRSETLYAAIRRLAKVDRTLILLSLDGFSYREIAAITDLTEANVGVRLNRARKRLVQLTEEKEK